MSLTFATQYVTTVTSQRDVSVTLHNQYYISYVLSILSLVR